MASRRTPEKGFLSVMASRRIPEKGFLSVMASCPTQCSLIATASRRTPERLFISDGKPSHSRGALCPNPPFSSHAASLNPPCMKYWSPAKSISGRTKLPPSHEIILEHVRGVDGLLCLLTDKINSKVMDAAGPGLKVISNCAVGVDNVDVPAATGARHSGRQHTRGSHRCHG